MCNHSTQELASIAINSARGGNMILLERTLKSLQEKPPSKELFRAICSIMVTFGEKRINGSFLKTAERIFNSCAMEG